MRVSRILAASFVLGLILISPGLASEGPPPPEKILLWPKGAPGAVGETAEDRPELTLYRPSPGQSTGSVVIICPGGGYAHLASDYEGNEVALWLNSQGVTAGVLKYRLAPRYHHPAPIQDAQRAIRLVRSRATEWGIDPNRVAILGFSAGGHLASTASTHFDKGKSDAPDAIDRQGCRPDRAILLYPVIALATPFTHGGSRDNLLGKNPDRALLESLSNETQVTKQTPPTFIAHTNEDGPVPAENSLLYVLALRKAKVPVEMHLFETGRHGLGLGKDDKAFAAWPGLCATWLGKQGFLSKK